MFQPQDFNFDSPLPGATPFLTAPAGRDGEAPFDDGAKSCTVILVSGAEDGGRRAILALSMACAALSMDLDTQVFLVGDGSIWAYGDHAEQARLHGFPPLTELLEDFQGLGGNITVCSSCDRALCGMSAGDVSAGGLPPRRRPGIQVQGMAALMERVMAGRAVTF